MHEPITQETVDSMRNLITALSGTGSNKPMHITPVRVCDHCLNKDKEAHPYNVADRVGRVWQHLYNECFDDLGCNYDAEDDAIICAACDQPITGDDIDERHWGHETYCPNSGHHDDDEWEMVDCRCDAEYHADCCPDCKEDQSIEG